MKRTINYTGRRPIYHEDVRIVLIPSPCGTFSFDVGLDLSEYALPRDGGVFVEAYRQTTWRRFPWGTVGELKPPSDRLLRDFESPEDIRFRVKVIGGSPRAQLLAEADQIRPRDPGDDEAGRIPLLPVKPEDLGEEAWRVELDGTTARLLVNSSFGDVHSTARSPEFLALVYPAALRVILQRVLCERESDGELPSRGEPDDWQARWIRFCQQLPGVGSTADPFESTDVEQREQWIDEAVRAFCRRQRLRDVLLSLGTGGQQA